MGASLLAIAVDRPTSKLTDTLPSRASSLPQVFPGPGLIRQVSIAQTTRFSDSIRQNRPSLNFIYSQALAIQAYSAAIAHTPKMRRFL
nr:hypothetical protein C1892_16155 [Pseudomonas sp. MPBD7-1]